MPIGRFSRLSGLTVKALRLYDRLDLLRPAMVDLQSGYRYYRPDQVPVARYVRLLRSLDVPLPEVRALLSAASALDAERSLALLMAHRRRLEERIADDRQALRLLQRLIDESCDRTRKDLPVADSKDQYHCSFCGKERQQVKRLIAGPNGVFICTECITLCNQIIAEQEAKGA